MFKVGDTVQLKSGSPVMTVISVGGGNCICTWFLDGLPQKHAFIAESLMSVQL